jgi:hypothetical protein
MGTAQLGIMVVMIIMRTAPDTARAKGQNPEYPHEKFSRAGIGQNGMMLLVVVDDKQSKNQQPGHDTADDLPDKMNIPECPEQGRDQKKRG